MSLDAVASCAEPALTDRVAASTLRASPAGMTSRRTVRRTVVEVARALDAEPVRPSREQPDGLERAPGFRQQGPDAMRPV